MLVVIDYLIALILTLLSIFIDKIYERPASFWLIVLIFLGFLFVCFLLTFISLFLVTLPIKRKGDFGEKHSRFYRFFFEAVIRAGVFKNCRKHSHMRNIKQKFIWNALKTLCCQINRLIKVKNIHVANAFDSGLHNFFKKMRAAGNSVYVFIIVYFLLYSGLIDTVLYYRESHVGLQR